MFGRRAAAIRAGRTFLLIHFRLPVSRGSRKRRFAIYVPDELAPEVQIATENGRQLQNLMKEAGLRYVKARKNRRD